MGVAAAVGGGRPGCRPGGWRGAGGQDAAHQRDSSDEKLLAVWDHVERQIAAAMARARESVVALEYTAGDAPTGTRRVASGVVINHRGEILSVRIDPPQAPGVRRRPRRARAPAPIVAHDYLGRPHAARWLAADPHTGLTLLLVAPRILRPMRAAADGPKLGSQVFVVGNPFGMGHSVSPGHVAGLDRTLELGERQLGGLILVQAPLYPGDSGASVVNVRGDWLGLIRGGLAVPGMGGRPSSTSEPGTDPGPWRRCPETPLIRSRRPAPRDDDADDDATDRTTEQDTDFGFAIPTRDALWIADQLRSHGRVNRAYLGVHFETAPVSASPIAVPEPTPSAPAPPSASSSASATGLWRGATGAPGSSETGADPIARRSSAATEPDLSPLPGEGARLRDVVPDTPAARAGLRPGDRIVSLDGQPIRSRNDLIDRLDRIPARKTIVLGVVREGEPGRPRLDVSSADLEPPGPAVPTASPPVAIAGGAVRAAVNQGERLRDPHRVDDTLDFDDHRGPPRSPPPPADPSATTPRQDPAPNPVPPAPDRAEPSPPASAPSPAINDLRLTLPRAVERIEQLERRIQELEQSAAGAGTAAVVTREPDSKVQPDRAKATGGRRP